MSAGTITEARRDDTPEGQVKIGDRTFWRWFVEIDCDGKRIKTAVLRKPDSPDPTGEPAFAETKNGKLRWKVGRQNGTPRGRSPQETKAIQRQHSQEMALRYCAIKAQLGQIEGDFKPTEHLKPIIDWFERDIAS